MVDVAVAAQLQQWSFEKPSITTRPERASSDSSSSSPKLCDDLPETLRIDAAPAPEPTPASRKESIVLQERYMSSEEHLSSLDDASNSEAESDFDYDNVVVHDVVTECKARTMSISRWDKGLSCDMAVAVSYAFAGRPKVVELDCRSPVFEVPMRQQRSASLAQLPMATVSKLRAAEQAQRLSMNVMPSIPQPSPPTPRTASPSIDPDNRRPSTSYVPSGKPTSLHLTDSASSTSSFQTAPSSRSISPTSSEAPSRPSTSAPDSTVSARSSVYIPSGSRVDLTRPQFSQPSYRQSQFAPLTPSSPSLSFLSSDPYENSTTNAASPIIKKPTTHKRLRSISMKLSLARIAITPSKKPYDSRINGKAPATPSTPYTPMTPQTAPLEPSSNFSGANKLRRASTILRPKSRHGDSAKVPTPESAPPMPDIRHSTIAQRSSRMVARGADEREPTLILPPCPDNADDNLRGSIKSRRIRKRKSLMDLL